ncbi:MAG: fibronectin type III domain-containing protein, partial [Clostridia bacterium]|nr:fibronectin type III domain-containing protein [Clostridia bacterium]
MKTSKKLFSLIFAIVLIASLSLAVHAVKSDTENPVSIVVETDKNSYSYTKIATFNVTVTNSGDTVIKDVTAQVVFDKLSPVAKGSNTHKKEAKELKPGESLSFSYKATLHPDKNKLNFFQKIIMWFVQFFNSGYDVSTERINDGRNVTEHITEINFGKNRPINIIEVAYNMDAIPESPDTPDEPEVPDVPDEPDTPDIPDNGTPEKVTGITITELGSAYVSLMWEPSKNADSYLLLIRPKGTSVWTSKVTTHNAFTFSGLSSETAYEIIIYASNNGVLSKKSNTITIITEAWIEEPTEAPSEEEDTTEAPSEEDTTFWPWWEEETTTEAPSEEVTTEYWPWEEETTEPPAEEETTTEAPSEEYTTSWPSEEETTTEAPSEEETTTEPISSSMLEVYDLKYVSSTDSSITVTWSKNYYANSYLLLYSEYGSNNWRAITTVSTICTIKNLKADTPYQIKATGYNGIYGYYSPNLIIYTKSKSAALTATSVDANNIKPSWEALSGASTYDVQYYSSVDDEWLTIPEAPLLTERTFTDKPNKSGRQHCGYLYRVVGRNSLGDQIGVTKTVTGTTKGLTVTQDDYSATISWDSISNVKNYSLLTYVKNLGSVP